MTNQRRVGLRPVHFLIPALFAAVAFLLAQDKVVLPNITGGQHGSSNNVAACTACHIRVPHGGKLSRLFVTTNAPARYKIGTPAFSQVTKNASGKDGYGTGWPAGMRSSCGQHSSQTGSESW